ncbi:MAG: sulfite exporter TauE/SafE family protein [Chloroherpetonaceae bacterium]
MTEFFGFFGFGILNSLHCLGMCSPIVLAYSSRLTFSETSVSPQLATATHLLYNFGRITTYSFIGGACGLIGKMLNLSLLTLGFGVSHQAVGIVCGVLVFLFGLMQVGAIRRWKVLSENLFFTSSLFQQAVGRFMSAQSLSAKYVMGVLLGFLPCILTYSMFVTALSSGGFLEGFLMLLAFGLGTTPMLFLTGVFSSVLLRTLRTYGNVISGVAMLLLGMLLVALSLFHSGHD